MKNPGIPKRRKKAASASDGPLYTCERFFPEPDTGLTKEQVQARTHGGLVNVVSDNTSKTTRRIILENVFTYFNIIFFVLAAILIHERSFNNLLFLFVVLGNTGIGIAQELYSKYELDKLKIVTAPETTVIRDGQETVVPSETVVLDEMAQFSAGSQICADAVVAAGEAFVNEALVTGESAEVKKLPGDALLAGSFVVSGTVRARVDKIGDDSFAARLSREAKQIKKRQQPGMMRSLTRLIGIIGVIIIPFGILMFWNQHMVLELTRKASVENAVASVIGMIPEGLYLLTSVALAAGTIRLAKRKTLVHDMKCIEALARVDVICLDKTGTITEPEMKLAAIIPVSEIAPAPRFRKSNSGRKAAESSAAEPESSRIASGVSGSTAESGNATAAGSKGSRIGNSVSGGAAEGSFVSAGKPASGTGNAASAAELSQEDVEILLFDFVGNMSTDNETMAALQDYFDGTEMCRPAVRVRGFSSQVKYSAVDFGTEAYVLGAPEFLLSGEGKAEQAQSGLKTSAAESSPKDTGDVAQKETQDQTSPAAGGPVATRFVSKRVRTALDKAVEEHSARGERVLLFAAYEFTRSGSDDIFAEGTLGAGVTPLALVTFANPIRKNAVETFRYFAEEGVSVRVISGDNPLTASAAAAEAGIPGAERYVDASTLKDKKAVEKAAAENIVFGRVTPDQKRMIVQALKKQGHTVAMTGDGVNDVLALKDADCSIAMASGSDAAANVADLVLVESDFSCMPHVVDEGRRVINNIERSASLYLVKNIFSFLLSLISLISVSLYPLKPVQLTLISAVMIGIPSFVLALEPNHERIKGKFLRNVMFRAAPTAICAVILVEWSLLFADAFGIDSDLASTTAFLLLAASCYIMLFRVCRPMNKWHWLLFVGMGAAFVLLMVGWPDFFYASALDYGSVLVLSVLLALCIPLHRGIKSVFDWAGSRKERRKKKKEEKEQKQQEKKGRKVLTRKR